MEELARLAKRLTSLEGIQATHKRRRNRESEYARHYDGLARKGVVRRLREKYRA